MRTELLANSAYFLAVLWLPWKGGFQLWKKVWVLNLPPKSELFLWKSVQRILPVKVNLLCRVWGGREETIEHVFFYCEFAPSV